ncbi:hypothetical protein DH2020_022501 [Rehmannia glutinosa]|uniref:S-protein homolog n=1 Tax=Rehmannia glutinosa TaxID=99300 RepID=A0ABR0WGF3_REHGL
MEMVQKFEVKTMVRVSNQIPGESVTAHCYSSDDDLGTHTLAYAATFSWSFRTNIFGTTKFYCDFKTTHGSGNYGVFTSNVELVCGTYCVWDITAKGPCVHDQNKGTMCQEWKNHP